jgi:hypothetical protein
MNGSYDQRAAARKDADLLVRDLDRVSGLLEEVATVWRRAEIFGAQPSASSPGHLQGAARRLADTLPGLPDADPGQHQALVFAAVTQLAALERDVIRVAAVTGDRHLGDSGLWRELRGSLGRAGNQLWRLISHLVKIEDMPVTEDVMAGRESR